MPSRLLAFIFRLSDSSQMELEKELAAIEGGQPLNFTDKYITLIYPQKECLLDYFSEKTAVVLCGTNAVKEQMDSVERFDSELIANLLEHGVIRSGKTEFSVPAHRMERFFTEHLAIHVNTFAVGLSGVRVNCVTPGVIDTDMNAQLTEDDRAELADETPLGRIGAAEEVAQTILFLCGEGASFITGQVLGVSGGLVI